MRAFKLWSALICCRQFIFLLNNFHAKPLPWGLSPEVNSLFLSGLQKIEKETNKIVPELFFWKHNIFRETNLIKKCTLFIKFVVWCFLANYDLTTLHLFPRRFFTSILKISSTYRNIWRNLKISFKLFSNEIPKDLVHYTNCNICPLCISCI